MTQGAQRRLAAVVSADVVGYSRLMGGRSESGTLAALKAHRAELVDPAIASHGGRTVKTTGDGLLLEFPSVVAAVNCCVAVQDGMAQRNADVADDEAIRFRVGIHLGDVIADDDDIFGDGVNIAARLQAAAEPGSIAVSAIVHDYLDEETARDFVDLGERGLKNIRRPIRIWQRSADTAKTPAEPLALPDKPSIAVLPFENMSGDPEQEYFSDGITEDIITALSKIRWIFVIARNSSFAYKGTSPDIRRIAAELGVRYVLEGSVRKGGTRVRITAQLIDAASGSHVWAERYDRDLGDIFALQDEITATLIAAIEPELAKAERRRAIERPPETLDAWSWFQRGMWHHYRASKEDNAMAQMHLRRAIELDPEFSRALAALAHVHYWDVLFGYVDEPRAVLDEGLSLARRAIAADDKEPFAHFALGRISTLLGDLDTAIAELELAIDLSPSFAHAYYGLGNALNFAGHADRAVEEIDRAIRLNPHDPAIWTFVSGRALSLMLLQHFDEALVWALKGVRQANAGWLSYAILAGVQAELGRKQDADQAVADTPRLKPDFSVSFIAETFPFQDPIYRDRFMNAMRKAGFPE